MRAKISCFEMGATGKFPILSYGFLPLVMCHLRREECQRANLSLRTRRKHENKIQPR